MLALVIPACWRLGCPNPAQSRNPDASASGGRTADTRGMRPETFRPIPHRGEPHSFAISDLVSRTKANERLSPTDIQALVAFISSPKPGDSTDGEWEERVNGVLNLLRRQTQDFKMQDAREEGATSLASSGPASQGAAGPPRPTRSDRIDWGRVDGVLKEASRRLAGPSLGCHLGGCGSRRGV